MRRERLRIMPLVIIIIVKAITNDFRCPNLVFASTN